MTNTSIKIISDTHLEYNSKKEILSNLSITKKDTVILAGDIGKPATLDYFNLIKYISTNSKNVILIAGNHEYYNSNKIWSIIETTIEKVASNFDNVYFLQNKSVILDGVKYIGTTLWSDVSKNILLVSKLMNDYCRIKEKINGIKKPITPAHTLHWHNLAVDYIEKELKKEKIIPIVMVTHHLPSFKSLKGDKKDGCFSSYATNLEYLISKVDIWVHGHHHKSIHYKINDTLIISNPLGRISYEDTGYDKKLSVLI